MAKKKKQKSEIIADAELTVEDLHERMSSDEESVDTEEEEITSGGVENSAENEKQGDLQNQGGEEDSVSQLSGPFHLVVIGKRSDLVHTRDTAEDAAACYAELNRDSDVNAVYVFRGERVFFETERKTVVQLSIGDKTQTVVVDDGSAED